MTGDVYFWSGTDRRAIAQVMDETVYWLRQPQSVLRRVHAYGPYPGVMAGEQLMSGDEFWEQAGSLAWDYSRIGASR